MAPELFLHPRLDTLARLVPGGPVADIGTDHGLLPTWLLLQKRVPSAIAADILPGPLDSARRTAARWGVSLDLRLGDGLTVLSPGEAETIVIAGMGGDNIAAILSAAPWTREAGGPLLLLQPMSRAEALRRWLAENGYVIRGERLAREKDTLYPILSAVGGEMAPVSEAQAWGGVLLEGDPLWRDYLARQTARLRRAAAGMVRDPALEKKREALLRTAAELERRAVDADSGSD